MAKVKVDVPYFAWRAGRPRWVPGPKLRAAGWKGRDLKDPAGRWLGFEAAIAAAREINRQVGIWREEGARRAPPKPPPRGRSVADLLEAFVASADVKALAPKTRRDYRTKADAVIYEPASAEAGGPGRRELLTLFGRSPVDAIQKPEVKAFFEHLERSRGLAMARASIAVLSAAWKWGTTSTGWRLGPNPCYSLGLRRPEPRLVIWTVEEVRAFVAAADAAGRHSVADAVYIALFCGQREADVLALADRGGSNQSLAERAREGDAIRIRQAKTGARVAVFAAPALVRRLEAAEARRRALPVVPVGDVPICLPEGAAALLAGAASRFGREPDLFWNEHTFRHRFAEIRAAAAKTCPSLAHRRFADLRDTAVTWLSRAGATLTQIASVTGHSLKSIHGILVHYLELGEDDALEATRKLVAWMEAEGMHL